MDQSDLSLVHKEVLAWYADHRRDLPWRRPGIDAWAVLVSEVMLQQTPVVRVLPAYDAWMTRWPTPGALADDSPGEAVRMWGRLGYPRRALRLHAAAVAIEAEHDGGLPTTYDGLRALPGVGDYTANAILAFAYRMRVVVLDTNVRRVLARLFRGVELPADAVNAAERRLGDDVLPDDPETAATWSVAVMELGALVCQARTPRCTACPAADRCAWLEAGFPAYDGPPRKVQTYAGTDRQVRGRILAVLRESEEPVPVHQLTDVWDDAVQRDRALSSLLEDGLVVERRDGLLALP
jgi:A/G-specific adenine glycosylase